MTVKTSLSTKGVEEYLERLAAAGQDIDRAADDALLPGGEVLQKSMQDLVPIDTGNLLEHIQIDGPHQDGNYHTLNVGIIDKREYTDADTARYANAVEFGTANMDAQPFIRPGTDRAQREAKEAMKQSLIDAGAL